MGERHLTIEDIAREAHVGIGTVSRVLNDSPHISEHTKKAVMDVIRAYNYQPNAVAAHLARKTASHPFVAILLPDIANRYFFEVFETIYRHLKEHGIHLIILNYEEGDGQAVPRILETNLSALIFFAVTPTERERTLLKARNIPYLYLDERIAGSNCIHMDNKKGGMLAANYLIENQVHNPCFVHGAGGSETDSLRFAGFCEVLEKHGYPSPGTFSATLSEQEGKAIGREIIESGTYDGVFCFCDEQAIGILKASRELQKPLRIIGYDGIKESEAWNLSTVSQEPIVLGARTSEVILELLGQRDEGKHPIDIQLAPILIDRGS